MKGCLVMVADRLFDEILLHDFADLPVILDDIWARFSSHMFATKKTLTTP